METPWIREFPRVPAIVAGLWLAFGGAVGQVQYVEVGSTSGILPLVMADGMGAGVAAADFDDDGDIDLFVPNAEGFADQLYRNLGNGQFEEIATAAGLASLERSRVALWFDYDGDGMLDLFVAGDCHMLDAVPGCTDVSTLQLYRQVASAVFQDVTVAAGLLDDIITTTAPHRTGVAAGDLNNDGWLDLLFGAWDGEARLFFNDGDGTFSEAIGSGIDGDRSYFFQPMMFDVNGDGWLDIYYPIDNFANRLFVNQMDNTFLEQAVPANLDNAMNDMGLTLGDYDNDGDFDIYVTNIDNGVYHNVLFRNDTVSSPDFAEVSVALDVDNGGWGWGTTFLDANNDGWLDLAATNGWGNIIYGSDTSRLFLNSGGTPVAFTDVASVAGFDDPYWGSALVALDYDRDGDLDVVQSCDEYGQPAAALRLLQNQLDNTLLDQNYLVIKPRMTGPNRRAIGAVVRATVGSIEMMRIITAGTSFLGQEPAEAFFGLGNAAVVDQLTIEWPDGTTDQRNNVTVNQELTVNQFVDTDGDGTPDSVDPDDDNDGVLDGSDCAALDDQLWQNPGAVSGLTLAHAGAASGTTTLSWLVPSSPGGTTVSYDTIASFDPGDFGGTATCVETNDATDTSAADSTVLSAGEILYFLPRAGNGCGEGSAGADSFGATRTLRGCP